MKSNPNYGYGYYAEINNNSANIGQGEQLFSFFSAGNAPNFFQGNTYIGGSSARNTLELWKSTLTEEQEEQLSAGTLTVPANVSTPGDGSFARQWWYNQQSAEDQALIDAGELEYPSHFQAANFVDTFDLGDNTNINLLSNGLGEFKGGVKVSGGLVSQVETGFSFSNGQLVASTKSHGSESCGLKCIHQGDGSNSSIASSLQISRGGANGSERPDYRGIFIENIKTNDASETVYGIYSQVGSGPGTNYNFYTAGTAPNYFAGSCFLPRTTYSTTPKQTSGDPNSFIAGVDNYHMINASTNTRYIASSHKASKAAHFDFWNNNSGSGRNVATISTDSANLVIENLAGGTIDIVPTSDYRLKTNVQALANSADVIKSLNPISFINTLNPGVTQLGFIAHELQEHVPQAVRGSKDATEAIGTLTDWDGTELETNVTEPEDLTYTEDVTDSEGVTTQAIRTRTWTPTGTQPVYQGVDQTKLIPLLTKALQEALDRVEQLEAQLGSGGGSDFESRIAALEVDMARFKAI